MTTFLQLCQRVRYECGLAGVGDVPASVLNQTGVLRKVVDRTARAWVDIQSELNGCWKFLRKQKVYQLVIGQREYSVAVDLGVSDLGKWDKESSCIYKTSTADETALTWIEYRDFRRRYHSFSTGRPCVVTDKVKDSLAFDLTPDSAYTATLDYWKTPVVLAANADVPDIPVQHADVIVWKSVMMFAGNEISPELLAYATGMYTKSHFKLILDQGDLPDARRSYPLAHGSRTNPVPYFGWR